MNSIEALLKTDFGNPDGLYDYNLENYFLDQKYWENIIDKSTFFVIGRKGTGKSAVYNWIYNRQPEKDVIVSNLSFKTFPFEKLLKLSDDDFSRPNQYQSIWKNIILSEFALQIMMDTKTEVTESYKELREFVDLKYGKNLKDLHTQITQRTNKTELGLQFNGLGPKSSSENTQVYDDGYSNITQINSRLEDLIVDVVAKNQQSYIIQFDQLDDNYTQYVDNKKYFEALISLFKVIYAFNSTLLGVNAKTKVIAYLRSDIFNQFSSHDPDSAKFDYHTFKLNWSIINKNDWENPALLNLINIRINSSVKEVSADEAFDYIFNKKVIKLFENNKISHPFRYIIHRTFHRPRDIIQFCIKVKNEAYNSNKLDFTTIRAAEKEYSSWLIDELKNEISPIIPQTDTLFTFLRSLGTKPFSSQEFQNKFNDTRNKNINKSPQALLRYLYSLGMIQNINFIENRTEYFSIIRNDKSNYEPRLKAVLHSGLIKGLYTFHK